ncbi:hypothetical protein KTR66_20850 [Roseococcus sp. SDR]|uniref:hypothetical protein n=1 Tax=Roseococcus sp. SDR TaxID=2835532 RepID=UPI001BCC45ED|nr:hypothetical protein [Roseococcus sp. SDR]MBS7792454.1 hypothetical protein [Roseococcus sp. SDR]MBV1847768.1 hypothetical protein [Roseococcus sp. SDR]
MVGKVIVVKPMVWNTMGYLRPDGVIRKNAGYVTKAGFGHEEWNGDPNRTWDGSRVFHTETTEKLTSWGDGRRLGIIMTAYNNGTPYALGIATSVLANTEEEKQAIFKALRLKDEADKLWALPSVRKTHRSLAAVRARWREEGHHNNWRCPPAEFAWFREPVPLDTEALFPPEQVGGKPPVFIKMHSRFMPIRPDQALSIVEQSLDMDSPILRWLRTGPFDLDVIAKKTKSYGKPKSPAGRGGGNTAAPADQPYVRYVTEHELKVTPRHGELQARLKAYITTLNISNLRENFSGVDIDFTLQGRGHVLAEVKPCDPPDVRYAVRTAMGQLLDYQQKWSASQPHLLVVVGSKPGPKEMALALENGFGIAHPRAGGFTIKWPAT